MVRLPESSANPWVDIYTVVLSVFGLTVGGTRQRMTQIFTHIHPAGWGSRNVYCETIKRELNRRLKYECRCDERLKVNLRDLHASHTLG